MNRIRKFNEDNELEVEDLIQLFADLSDDNLTHVSRGIHVSGVRNIAITIGEYFRSDPFILDELSGENKERVVNDLARKRPFWVNIQIDGGDKLQDMIKVLQNLDENKDSIKYFGYKFDDFYLEKTQTFRVDSDDCIFLEDGILEDASISAQETVSLFLNLLEFSEDVTEVRVLTSPPDPQMAMPGSCFGADEPEVTTTSSE